MELIEMEAAKAKKVYCEERHEYVVPVAELDWLPTIDAAPVVHSQWEECDDDVNAWIRCPECGFEQDIDYFGEHPHEIDDYKVCPNCGARMGGGEGHEAD